MISSQDTKRLSTVNRHWTNKGADLLIITVVALNAAQNEHTFTYNTITHSRNYNIREPDFLHVSFFLCENRNWEEFLCRWTSIPKNSWQKRKVTSMSKYDTQLTFTVITTNIQNRHRNITFKSRQLWIKLKFSNEIRWGLFVL